MSNNLTCHLKGRGGTAVAEWRRRRRSGSRVQGGGEKEGEGGTEAGSADEETVASKYLRVGA